MAKKQRLIRRKTAEKSRQISEAVYDPFSDFQGSEIELYIAKFFYYIRSHFKQFLMISFFVIFAFLVLLFYHIHKENLEHKALLAFEELEKNPLMQKGGGDIKVALKKLDQYINQYNVVSAKKRAIIKKIQLLEYSQDYENAAIQYEELAKLMEYPELKINFLYRSAIYFENSKKYSRALTNLEEITKYKITNHYIIANVLYAQARVLNQLGKKQDAKRVALKILDLEEPSNLELKNLQMRVVAYFLLNH